jgi:dTDP-4-dehydrorhamnose 3,5-epimerase
MTEKKQIEGVKTLPLKIIEDERGAVLHMLRCDHPVFSGFGEVYFSEVKANVIKGWKLHKEMTQRFSVPVGRVKFVVYDNRETSKTFGCFSEYELGRPDDYQLLIVPAGVWYGFKGLGHDVSLIANCADRPHSLDECEHKDLKDKEICYQWNIDE